LNSFPKKWIIVSVLFHATLFIVLYFVSIDVIQLPYFYEIDLRYLAPEPEIPPPAVEQPREITEAKEPSLPMEEKILPEKEVLQERIETPEVIAPIEEPKTLLYRKDIDSTIYIYARIDSFIQARFVVPYNVDVYAILRDSLPPRIPTQEDTLRMLSNLLQNFTEQTQMSIYGQDYSMRRIDEEYSSHLNPEVAPVGVLIGLGAKVLGSLFSSILPEYDEKTIDRYLDIDEIDVMLPLWKLRQAESLDIYRKLPPTSNLVFSDVIRILEQLEKKMVVNVQRKIDENTGGMIKLDFNRSEAQYKSIYIPLITRLELVNFYDSVLADTVLYIDNDISFTGKSSIESLKEKIRILTREPFEFR